MQTSPFCYYPFSSSDHLHQTRLTIHASFIFASRFSSFRPMITTLKAKPGTSTSFRGNFLRKSPTFSTFFQQRSPPPRSAYKKDAHRKTQVFLRFSRFISVFSGLKKRFLSAKKEQSAVFALLSETNPCLTIITNISLQEPQPTLLMQAVASFVHMKIKIIW